MTKQSNKQTNTILMHRQLNLAYKVYTKSMLILVIIVGTWLGFLFQEWREILIPACVKVFHIHFNLPSANINLPHEKKKVNRCFVGCLEFLLRQPLHTYKCHTALTRSIIFPTSCNLSSPYSWLLTSFLCIRIKYFRLAVLSFSLKKLLTSLSSSFNLSARKKSTFKQFCCKYLKFLYLERYKLL